MSFFSKITLFFLIFFLTCPMPAENLYFRAKAYANWFQTGQKVCFTASRKLNPDENFTVKIVDIAGNTVHSGKLSAAEFNQQNEWSYLPAEPGYYEAEFIRDSDGTTLTETYRLKVFKHHIVTGKASVVGEADIPVPRIPFAVANPPRPAGEISPVFGMSPHSQWYRDFLPLGRRVGFRTIRNHYIDWAEIEPRKGEFHWEKLDEFMELSRKNGYRCEDITLNVFGVPQWASTRPEATNVNICIQEYKTVAPKNQEDWKNFLQHLARRYPAIRKYELFNEPHFDGFSCFWNDTPENFITSLKTGAEAIREVKPDAVIHLGGLGMGYLEFFEEIVSKGADQYFDVLTLHGRGVDPAPFNNILKKAAKPLKPWLNSEWHAMLQNVSSPEKSELLLSRIFVLDFLRQIRLGAEEVDFFSILNWPNGEIESLAYLRKMNPGSTGHVSGLFRRTPYLAPRYPAVVWHTLSNLVSGCLRVNDGYRLGNDKKVCALSFASDSGERMIFWNEDHSPVKLPPELAGAIGNANVLHADGRTVSAPAEMELLPEYFYIAVAPENPASLKGKEAEVLITEKSKIPLSHKVHGNFLRGTLFSSDMKQLSADARKIPALEASGGEYTYPRVEAGEIRARFKTAVNDSFFELYAEVQDPVHAPGNDIAPWEGDSIQFCFDTAGNGMDSDRMEFSMYLDNSGKLKLLKNRTPELVGDLPVGYTRQGGIVENAVCTGKRMNGKTLYAVKIALTELFPLRLQPNKRFRFALLVNNNDGKGRAFYREWASGIGGVKDPCQYGDMTLWQEKRNLAENRKWKPAFTKELFTVTEFENGWRINGEELKSGQAIGRSFYADGFKGNADYRLQFEARGTARLQILSWMEGKRVDILQPTKLKPDTWQKFDIPFSVPPKLWGAEFVFFNWEFPNVRLEVRNVNLTPF